MATAMPEQIADQAASKGCQSVAFTYNDPVIFHEYAADAALACREQGLKTVAVTAGYISREARADFFSSVDAANVDLKAFTEGFYRQQCGAELAPVLDTLRYLYHETDCWLEITCLLIPGLNENDDEIKAMTDWILCELGPDVPLHFSAFHPDYKMRDRPATLGSTLSRARHIALNKGLSHVYTGNVHDQQGDTTYCSQCQTPLIVRDWYQIKAYHLSPSGQCPSCGCGLAGYFADTAGDWGRRREPLKIIN